MDNLESKTTVQTETTDLPAEFEALRHLVVSILILMLVVSGTLSIYLLRQWRTTVNELKVIRPQVSQMAAIYQKDEFPWMKEILNRLSDYGRTHPDYMPVLAKYNIKPGATTGAPAGGAAAPAPAAQKK